MERSEGIDPAMKCLRARIPGNVLEHRAIMECLLPWANPQSKLTRLVQSGALLRIRSGLYIFGPSYRKEAIALPALANMVMGPSYVSFEWALSYYGLIPEAVVAVTSSTFKRGREFTTPIGRFIYEHVHPASYSTGITWIETQAGSPALIATAEKALVDQLVVRKGKVTSLKQLEEILEDDLRIDDTALAGFDIALLKQIYDARPHSAVHYLIQILKRRSS